MELNTTLVDNDCYYKIMDLNRKEGGLVVNNFLERFYSLFDNLKESVLEDAHHSRLAHDTAYHASRLGAFIRDSGGTRAASMLAEYEKHASVADFVSCSMMEKRLFEEIEAFRELVVSMFS